jgi:hypothetical protein
MCIKTGKRGIVQDDKWALRVENMEPSKSVNFRAFKIFLARETIYVRCVSLHARDGE